MAHKEQREYFLHIKNILPDYFKNKKVLDVGSLDVNGNNRHLFENCNYIGIDIAEGKNVDHTTLCHEYNAPDRAFDVIISNDCFEHDMYWEKSLKNIVRMLSPNGLFLFTCKTEGSGEHGTLRTDGGFSSPLTIKVPGWENYYRNIIESDVRIAISIEQIFSIFEFSINKEASDIRFYGVKK
jgi:SAM-dependent methyltransferase